MQEISLGLRKSPAVVLGEEAFGGAAWMLCIHLPVIDSAWGWVGNAFGDPDASETPTFL